MSEDPPALRSSLAASLALLAPLAVTLCLSGYVVLGWALGIDPFWASPDLTVAEAALVRDVGETVRLIHAGHDPNRRWPVRAELSDSHQPEMLTALEAAIQIRRLEIVQVLMGEGARVSNEETPALIEFARKAGAPDIADYLLSRQAPPQ